LKCFSRVFFIVLISAFFCGFGLHGQNILEPEELKMARTFESMEEAMQQPDSVIKLDLSRSKLTQIPAEVFTLPNLQWLNLSKNKIKVIPADIEKLKSLQELDVSNNDLTQLPPQIGELLHLTKLKLNKNEITSLPPEIGNLIHLEVFEMWNNELDTIPDEVRHLVRLKTWELRGILFSDEKQKHIHSLLPETKIYFSPSCACKQ